MQTNRDLDIKEEIKKYVTFLKEYDGETLRLMEVCGSHTAAISKSGIKKIISPKIKLISGPGCPVCVSPSAFVDRLIELGKKGAHIVSFGDMMRIPGSTSTLNEEKGKGLLASYVYSPLDIIEMAKKEPEREFIFAAVGFETTIPTYTLLLDRIIEENITNIKLLTALKTMPEAIDFLCMNKCDIDGFIAPGHVSVITGSDAFNEVSSKYKMPMAVTGFSPYELVLGIYALTNTCINKEKYISMGKSLVGNYYKSVVETNGNQKAQKQIDKYFRKGDAIWRGMGNIPNSGLYLKDEYLKYDAGSQNLNDDKKINKACRCSDVLMGKISSKECPLFKKICNPLTPQGACMVSSEGSCYQAFKNND